MHTFPIYACQVVGIYSIYAQFSDIHVSGAYLTIQCEIEIAVGYVWHIYAEMIGPHLHLVIGCACHILNVTPVTGILFVSGMHKLAHLILCN